MIYLFALSLLPVGYGGLYLLFSIRNRRPAQAVAVAVPILLLLAVLGVLLWEFLRLP